MLWYVAVTREKGLDNMFSCSVLGLKSLKDLRTTKASESLLCTILALSGSAAAYRHRHRIKEDEDVNERGHSPSYIHELVAVDPQRSSKIAGGAGTVLLQIGCTSQESSHSVTDSEVSTESTDWKSVRDGGLSLDVFARPLKIYIFGQRRTPLSL